MSRAINTITAATAVDGATNLNIDSGTLFVDTTNNIVGIGTTSPTTQLQINSSATTYSDQLRIRNTNYGNADIGVGSGIMAIATDNANIAFYTSSNLGATGSALPNNERLRIDSSGNVLVNTTANDTGGKLEVKQAAAGTGFGVQAQGNDNAKIQLRLASGSTGVGGEILSNGGLVFSPSNTPAMRIDSSGNVLVGTTTAIGKFTVEASGTNVSNIPLTTNSIAGSGNRFAAAFYYSGTKVGSIDVTASATSLTTSSDYRLKTNVKPISNGIERVKQLPVYSFNWKIDQDGNKVDGFFAHEAKAIVPECVSGEKDAVDADGNPIYQGIDQSKIVPLLTAALKEAIAKIETLESKVTALEAA